MSKGYHQTWDLDVFFGGGAASPKLAAELEALQQEMAPLREQVAALPVPDTAEKRSQWAAMYDRFEQVINRVSEAGSFVGCLISQNEADTPAKMLMGRLQQMFAGFQAINILMKDKIRQIPDETWQEFLADPRFAPFTFQLQETRDQIAEELPPAQETLISDLSVDGLQAWGRLYQTIVSRVKIEWEGEQLSAGQAYNKFADPDPARRAELMKKWEAAWAEQAELCAAALNHLGGFRLATYKARSWESVLARGLKGNRMAEASLNAMWNAIDTGKEALVKYFERKAKLLGVDGIHWYDEQAPVNEAVRKVSYDEAADFIVEQFERFSPHMADFARTAFDQRWIEAEDRPGKAPGGYCTGMAVSRQSRIFMTYGGTSWSVGTLAHELGHAYHFQLQWDLPQLARGFTMSTAETASTFAELVVSKAAMARATDRAERLALLDDSIRRTVAMFMNIRARFIFENRFYEARKKGLLSAEKLSEMMVEAQKEAFGDGLASYHPHFWASKGHFYGTWLPFYNYPYTVGYLFSAGIYAKATQEGPGFADRYVDLLRDTGRMTTEELARRHLDVDLTQPGFWQAAVDMMMADVHEFLRLTEGQ